MRRALFALALVLPTSVGEYRARLLDERCATLCPIIGKGDTGRGRMDGKCDCINVVDPFYYQERVNAFKVPRRKKEHYGFD